MSSARNLIVAFALMLCAGFAQAATMTADFVTVGIELDPALSDPRLGPQTFAVGGGTDGTFFGSQSIDANAAGGSEFHIRSSWFYSSMAGGNRVSWTVSGLQFSGGEVLVGLNFVRSIGNAIVTSLSDSAFTFEYDDTFIPRGRYFEIEYITAIPAAVPLPASVTLLGAALIGLGGLGWRRRRRAGTG